MEMNTQGTTVPFLPQLLKACKKAFIAVGLFSCLVNFLTLTISLYMYQIFDRVLASHSYETLIYLTLISLFALGVLSVLDLVRMRVLVYVSHWLDRNVSPEALQRSVDHLLRGQPYGPESLKDIGKIRAFLTSAGMLALLDAPWVPIFLLVIFLFNPILGILAIFGAAGLFGLALFNEFSTRHVLASVDATVMSAGNKINATLRNAETIQAMGMLPSIIQHWLIDNGKVLALQRLANERNGFMVAASKFFRFAIQIMMLGTGAFLVLNNQLTAGGMIAGSIILSRALAPIEQSIGVWAELSGAREAYKRLVQYFNRPTFRTGTTTLPTPTGKLGIKNVSFIAPNSDKMILRNINFNLTAGEVLALVGPSAAGKSTLARLLVGVWMPSMGNVRLDDADVYSWDRVQFGQYVGYLPQTIELFNGTVKENIARMQETSDQDVVNAAIQSGAHELILHLPQGYETIIQDGGSNLSGGQRQRIGLARAFFRNPKLIVLDEPTSNLDTEGDEALIKAIANAKAQNSTVVFIAHRPSIMRIADKILLLREGIVEMFGPKEEIFTKLQARQIIKTAG